MRVRVRYCGGCNPRYDRVALARRLPGAFPGVQFVFGRGGGPCGREVLVCGCERRCARPAPGVPAFILWQPEGWRDLCRWLRRQVEKQSQETAKGAERVALDDAL